MTAGLEGGEWSATRPGRTLPPGKTRYTWYRRLGGSQGRSVRAENLAPPGFDPRTVQPVVSRYTDWAIRPTYGAVVAWKWQKKTEVLGENRAQVPHCPPQISNWTALRGDAGDQPPDQWHAVLWTTMCHGVEMCSLSVSGSELTDYYDTTISEQWTGRYTEGSGNSM